MDKISYILKPKTQEQIIETICGKHDIPYSEEEYDALINLFSIASIKRELKANITKYYIGLKEEDDITLDSDNNFENLNILKRLTMIIVSDDVSINTKIKDWRLIYNRAINLIIKNADSVNIETTECDDLLSRIHWASKLYSHLKHIGNINFILCSEQNKKLIEKEKFMFPNCAIISNKKLGKKIIIGRKPVKDVDKGLYVFKYKNYYKLAGIGNIEGLFVSI